MVDFMERHRKTYRHRRAPKPKDGKTDTEYQAEESRCRHVHIREIRFY